MMIIDDWGLEPLKPAHRNDLMEIMDDRRNTQIASIEDPAVIKKILAHLDQDAPLQQAGYLPETRAPPPMGLFV